MTREEAIERLEWLRMVGNHVDSVTLGKEDMPHFDMAIAALREQEELESKLRVLESSGWISVEERLPEEKGQYLTIHKFCDHTICSILSWTGCYNGFDEYLHGRAMWYDYDSEYGDYEMRGITHWMPLPEPPKEDT